MIKLIPLQSFSWVNSALLKYKTQLDVSYISKKHLCLSLHLSFSEDQNSKLSDDLPGRLPQSFDGMLGFIVSVDFVVSVSHWKERKIG